MTDEEEGQVEASESLRDRYSWEPNTATAIAELWAFRDALANENLEEEGALPDEQARQLQAVALIEATLAAMDEWLATTALGTQLSAAIAQVEGHRVNFRLTQPYPTILVDFARDHLVLAATQNALPALSDAEQRHVQAIEQLDTRTAEAEATVTSLKETLEAANEVITSRLGPEGSETSALLTDAQSRVDDSIAAADRAFELELEKAKQEHEAERKSIVQFGEDAVREAERLLDELRRNLSISADDSLSAAYGTRANEEDKAANRMRNFALWFGIAAAAVAAGELVAQVIADSSNSTWALLPLKLTAALVLAGIGAYCGRESSRHRAFAQQLRIAQLELNNIGPYLAELDATKRAEVKERLVEIFFGRSTATAEPDSPTTGATVDQVLEVVRLFMANK
jgi:F0F1-type ATP synthase membrane subunit b/b'